MQREGRENVLGAGAGAGQKFHTRDYFLSYWATPSSGETLRPAGQSVTQPGNAASGKEEEGAQVGAGVGRSSAGACERGSRPWRKKQTEAEWSRAGAGGGATAVGMELDGSEGGNVAEAGGVVGGKGQAGVVGRGATRRAEERQQKQRQGLAAGFLSGSSGARGREGGKRERQGQAERGNEGVEGPRGSRPSGGPRGGGGRQTGECGEAGAIGGRLVGEEEEEDAEETLSAAEEKERGNALFKQGRYDEAIRCYSLSIALDPAAVTFANRAMAFLKISRYEDAERDCTEALSRHDEYVKALSRRATARLRLKRPAQALADVEAALVLEPESKQLRALLAEAQKAVGKEGHSKGTQPAGADAERLGPMQRTGEQGAAASVATVAASNPSSSSAVDMQPKQSPVQQKSGRGGSKAVDTVMSEGALEQPTEAVHTGPGEGFTDAVTRQETRAGGDTLSAAEPGAAAEAEAEAEAGVGGSSEGEEAAGVRAAGKRANGVGVREAGGVGGGGRSMGSAGELVEGALELLLRQRSQHGSMLATVPSSSYEFESAWRSMQLKDASSSIPLKHTYLKLLPPESLPALFKDSLSAPLLLDILRSLLLPASLVGAEAAWTVSFLRGLQSTPRFSISTLCFTPAMRQEVCELWHGALGSGLLPSDVDSSLQPLRTALRV